MARTLMISLRSFVAVLVLAVVAPLVGLVAIDSWMGSERQELFPSEPVFGVVGSLEDTARQPARIDLEWSESASVEVVLAAGTVTALYVEDGRTLDHADPVLAIDGIDRILVVNDSPFFRSLQRGDSGSDADALRDLLVFGGYLTEFSPGSRISSSEARAIRALQVDLGASLTPWGVFDPLWTVFAKAPLQIDTVAVGVGEILAGGNVAIGDQLPGLSSLEIVALGDANQSRRLVEQQLMVQVRPDFEMVIDDPQVNDPDLLSTFAQIVDPLVESVEEGVVVQLALPQEFASIPSASVAVSDQESQCIFVGDALAATKPIEVSTIQSNVNGMLLSEDLSLVGQRFLTNPFAVEGDLSCG